MKVSRAVAGRAPNAGEIEPNLCFSIEPNSTVSPGQSLAAKISSVSIPRCFPLYILPLFHVEQVTATKHSPSQSVVTPQTNAAQVLKLFNEKTCCKPVPLISHGFLGAC